MTLKSDVKFKKESTCCCKNDITYLINLCRRTRKSQNLHFDGILMPKVYKVLAKKSQRSYVLQH